MADLKAQRICVKYCLKLRKTVLETHKMLKTVFGDNAMGRTLSGFLDSKMGKILVQDVNAEVVPPQVAEMKTDIVKKIDNEGLLSNIFYITGRLRILYETCQQIVAEDLNMRPISAKFVPWLQQCVFVRQELLDEVRKDQNFISRVITGDKPGFTAMTQKPNSTPLHARRNQGKQDCFIHHDNAPAHTALQKICLLKTGCGPPYHLLDLAPCDFVFRE